ncbi:MAG: Phosphomannomutase [Candidatus Syntrophoarchaeum sp. GoM_oil]|nr:MAG: Phosphomannomutase [Candidatus Syntrophoarchaeum sp. GoM_oil]
MLKGVKARRSVIYNCIELSGFLAEEEVVADIFHPLKGKIRMRTGIMRDGKKDWGLRLLPNPHSYSELEALMKNVSIDELCKERGAWEKYFSLELGKNMDQLKNSPIKFRDNLVEKVWGGEGIECLKDIKLSCTTIGESWECSAHHANRSIIRVGEIDLPLVHLLNHCGSSIIGEQIYRDFKGDFPILIKFIDSKENLSIQVHPSDEDAIRLGESESGKTEGWYVIKATEGAQIYLGLRERDMDLSGINEECLNAVDVKSGDTFLISAGTLHAIGAGILLFEIQESSDLTYRVWDWGRERELHLEKAKEVYVPTQNVENLRQTPQDLAGERVLLDTFYFTLSSIRDSEQETKGSFHLLTCLEGMAEVVCGGVSEVLKTGETILVPASIKSYRISVEGTVLKSYLRTPEQIDPVIFQTYDVRALETSLSDRICYYLGKGYGTYLRRLKSAPTGELWVCIGGGIRLSTERIRKPLIEGVRSSGVNVYDVGITSTPDLYFSIPFLGTDGGINITASHNPAEYNGLKQVIKSEDGFISSINRDEMLDIKLTILESDFLYGNGECVKIDEGMIPGYHNILVESNCRLGREIWTHLIKNRDLKELLDTLSSIKFPEHADVGSWNAIREKLRIPDDYKMPETAIDKPLEGLKVVIDFGNGSAWKSQSVYRNLGCEVVSLNEFPDGNFPAHHPDPIKAKYRRELVEETVRVADAENDSKKEVLGFGHDEDGDRVIFIRSDGRVVEGDRTLAIQAKDIIADYRRKGEVPRPKFIGEVKFSRVTEAFITSNGGEYIMTPTGFAFIKERIKEECKGGTDVLLAGELSGHQMSGYEENWMFDDGTLAACKLLCVIAKARRDGKTFIDLDEEVPRYPATPEINIPLPTSVLDEKEEVVQEALKHFEKMNLEIDRTDGGLIKWYDDRGWIGQALVRKSNTQPMLICRIEGRDDGAKATVEEAFFGVLEKVSTDRVKKLDLESDDYVKEWIKEKSG